MRLFFGIILGILLTVGGAYIADSMTPATGKHMVDWTEVGTRFSNLGAGVRGLWGKLTGAPASTTTTTTAPAPAEAPAEKPAEKPAN